MSKAVQLEENWVDDNLVLTFLTMNSPTQNVFRNVDELEWLDPLAYLLAGDPGHRA